MAEEKVMEEDKKLFELNLGDRSITANGVTVTGKFTTTDEELFKAIMVEFKKPEIIRLNLGKNKMNLNMKDYHGVVDFVVSRWDEKTKKHVPIPQNIASYQELAYRLSLIEQNEQREKTKLPYKSNSMLRTIENGANLDNVMMISQNDHPGLIPESERNF